jgi:hypothetical protein
VHFRAAEWSRDQDRALIAEGWTRLRSGDTIACAVPAVSALTAPAIAERVLGIKPLEGDAQEFVREAA